jgi:hypothetical protein
MSYEIDIHVEDLDLEDLDRLLVELRDIRPLVGGDYLTTKYNLTYSLCITLNEEKKDAND